MTLREFLKLANMMVCDKLVCIIGSSTLETLCEVDCIDDVVMHVDDYLSDSILDMEYLRMSVGVDIDIFVE